MNRLIYVNGLGPNYKGDNLYEFIFSDSLDVWGESWESRPSNGYPTPPELKYIKKVGVLRNTDLKLELIQNSDFFCMIDCQYKCNILCLCCSEDLCRCFISKTLARSIIYYIYYNIKIILSYSRKIKSFRVTLS